MSATAEGIRVYRTLDDGVDDSGWGCVYRNIQSCAVRVTKPPPTVASILSFFDLEDRPPGRELWIEPWDAKCFFVAELGVGAEHILHNAAGQERFTRTPRDLPQLSRDEFVARICSHLSHDARNCTIIDDGCYSVVLLGLERDAQDRVCFLVGDPHDRTAPAPPVLRRQPVDESFLVAQWAACLVFAPSS